MGFSLLAFEAMEFIAELLIEIFEFADFLLERLNQIEQFAQCIECLMQIRDGAYVKVFQHEAGS